ncbi:hypothetical protein L3X38_024202 [Prunus dulcis]|uniref:Uncharacterized protein n=1 Tax=Prunus dulcis TaxID=3755 RepID=A0AAD4W0Y9_PRUDU|nr:hypothetical protein L3X38_024202 [Prunus dulcis]
MRRILVVAKKRSCWLQRGVVAHPTPYDNLSLGSLLKPAEKQFLEICANRYLGEVPQLSSVYQGKVDIKAL